MPYQPDEHPSEIVGNLILLGLDPSLLRLIETIRRSDVSIHASDKT